MVDTGAPPGSDNELRIAELRQRWQERHTPRVGLQLAEELRRAGRLEDSHDVLERNLDQNPGHLSSLVALGKVRLDLDDAAGAVRHFERVVDRDPTHLVANKLLVEAYVRSGEPEKASTRLEHYRLLNEGDTAIESLSVRIAELAAQRAEESWVEESGGSESEASEPVESEAAVADVDGQDDDLPGPSDDPAVLRAATEDGEPFPSLGAGELVRYLDGLRESGIFPLPDGPPEPSAAQEAAAEEKPADAEEPASAGEPEDAPAAADDEPAPASAERPRATSTLGELYLAQGHVDQAEGVFRQVLDTRPDDSAAAAGLAEVERRRHEVVAGTGAQPSDERPEATMTEGAVTEAGETEARGPESGVTAEALLRWGADRGVPGVEDAGDRRAAVLSAYKERLRQRAEEDRGEGEATDVP